jgi:hypothetical protein
MKSIAQEITDEITSPDFKEKSKKIVRGWAIEAKYRDKHTAQLREKLWVMSNPEFLSFISKICDRESNREHPTYLFTILLNVVCDPAYNRPVSGDGMLELYIYKGISFRLYFKGYRCKISMRKRILFESK